MFGVREVKVEIPTIEESQEENAAEAKAGGASPSASDATPVADSNESRF